MIDTYTRFLFVLVGDQVDQVIESGRDDHGLTSDALRWGGWYAVDALFMPGVLVSVLMTSPRLTLTSEQYERVRLAYNRAAAGQIWKTPDLLADGPPADTFDRWLLN